MIGPIRSMLFVPGTRHDRFAKAMNAGADAVPRRGAPGRAYEVEFSDDEGQTFAELALAPDQLLVLHHRPQRAA